jgi:hypothetical protein
MKPDIDIADLLFEVDQVPIEAVIGTNGHTLRLTEIAARSPENPLFQKAAPPSRKVPTTGSRNWPARVSPLDST